MTYIPKKLNAKCPHCGSRDTTEIVKGGPNTRLRHLYGMYCPRCGRESYDGTDPIAVNPWLPVGVEIKWKK